MSNYEKAPEGKDQQLWNIASKRARFKTSLLTYLLVNAFLWAIWYFTTGGSATWNNFNFPWPIWPTLGWGLGIAFQFADAYVFPKSNSTEREYEKLKNKNNI